jgi:hypothetical protein
MLDEDDDVQHDERRPRGEALERWVWGGSSRRAGTGEFMWTTTINLGDIPSIFLQEMQPVVENRLVQASRRTSAALDASYNRSGRI